MKQESRQAIKVDVSAAIEHIQWVCNAQDPGYIIIAAMRKAGMAERRWFHNRTSGLVSEITNFVTPRKHLTFFYSANSFSKKKPKQSLPIRVA
jgi:hypothetical protein